jgi:hypothetical protein
MHLTDVEKRSFKWGLLEEGISHGFSRRTVDHVKPHVPYRTQLLSADGLKSADHHVLTMYLSLRTRGSKDLTV